MSQHIERTPHLTPSVGTVVKKIVGINPSLGVNEIIDIIRQATRKNPDSTGAFSGTEVVDEALALELARATLTRKHP